MTRPYALLLISAGIWTGQAFGQRTTLTFDWSVRPKEVGQSISAPTLQLSSTQQVNFKIINVNDIFFSYGMSCTGTAKDSVLSLLPNFINPLEGATDTRDCNGEAKTLVGDIDAHLANPPGCDTSCASISLSDTLSKLKDYRQQVAKLLKCEQLNSTSKGILEDTQRRLDTLIKGGPEGHVVPFGASISPDQDYVCTITEYYKQSPTTNGTLTISVKPQNTIITLSLGPLFSAIQNRSYSAVAVPNSDSSGTSTVLGVGGASMSTSIGALVNFRLPIRPLSRDSVGLDLTAGPVFRLNSKSNTSTFGFFGGISIRLYRYVFLTPGVHVGDFADFPVGLGYPQHSIPANFGTLTPVTRTTAKFGLALTFQTKDFSSLGKSSATATTPPAGGAPPANPVPKKPVETTKPAPKPSDAPAISLAGPAGEPVTIDFGTIGTEATTKTLPLKNDWKQAFGPTITNPDATGQVAIEKPSACNPIDAGQSCSLSITVKPGAATPPVTLKITLADGSQQVVQVKWKRTQ